MAPRIVSTIVIEQLLIPDSSRTEYGVTPSEGLSRLQWKKGTSSGNPVVYTPGYALPRFTSTFPFTPPPSCEGKLCELQVIKAALQFDNNYVPPNFINAIYSITLSFTQPESFQSLNQGTIPYYQYGKPNISTNALLAPNSRSIDGLPVGPASNRSQIVSIINQRWGIAGPDAPVMIYCPQGLCDITVGAEINNLGPVGFTTPQGFLNQMGARPFNAHYLTMVATLKPIE